MLEHTPEGWSLRVRSDRAQAAELAFVEGGDLDATPPASMADVVQVCRRFMGDCEGKCVVCGHDMTEVGDASESA
jgi:hypothetical protein